MALLEDFFNKAKESASGSGVVGNAPGLDQNTAGLLGLAFMSATGNKNLARKMMALQMLNDPNATSFNGINPAYQPQVPQSMQNTVQGLMRGVAPVGLSEKLEAGIPSIMEELRAKGWDPIIASGVRTPEEQAEKVRLGYSKTMNSKHLHGNAVDIVDRRYGWNGPAADTNYQFWKDLGEAAKRQGFKWGGDWENFRDVAHIQTSFLKNQNPNQAVGLLNQQTYYA